MPWLDGEPEAGQVLGRAFVESAEGTISDRFGIIRLKSRGVVIEARLETVGLPAGAFLKRYAPEEYTTFWRRVKERQGIGNGVALLPERDGLGPPLERELEILSELGLTVEGVRADLASAIPTAGPA